MNFQRLESRVCLDEGFRAEPYLDTVGVPTIGYGTTRILGKAVSMNDRAIEEPIARQLLRQDLFVACMDVQDLFSRFDEMDSVRQEVLANMAYNLGRYRLGGFTKLLFAAESLDYAAMADHMQDSKWYNQVGGRAVRLCNAMRDGIWS